jgi:hypothetical protein
MAISLGFVALGPFTLFADDACRPERDVSVFMHQIRSSGFQQDKATRAEILLGRGGAYLTHPFAAWERRNNRTRFFLIAAYGLLSFAVTLAMLLISASTGA